MREKKSGVPTVPEETSTEFVKNLMKESERKPTSKQTEIQNIPETKPLNKLIQDITVPIKQIEPNTVIEPQYKIVHQGIFQYENCTTERVKTQSTRPDSLSIQIAMPKVVNIYVMFIIEGWDWRN